MKLHWVIVVIVISVPTVKSVFCLVQAGENKISCKGIYPKLIPEGKDPFQEDLSALKRPSSIIVTDNWNKGQSKDRTRP